MIPCTQYYMRFILKAVILQSLCRAPHFRQMCVCCVCGVCVCVCVCVLWCVVVCVRVNESFLKYYYSIRDVSVGLGLNDLSAQSLLKPTIYKVLTKAHHISHLGSGL